jgi:hypothetical protein
VAVNWRRLACNVVTTWLLWSSEATADPISASIGLLGGGEIFGLPTIGSIIAGFIGANVVPIALIGASLLINSFQQRPAGTSVYNVRIDAGLRRHAAGTVKVSGQALFGAFAQDGAFWYLVVHCDEELVHLDTVLLDDVEVTLDGSHRVTNPEFHAMSGGILGIGQGSNPFYSVWVQTYTTADPVPPPLAGFKLAFPAWTDDHKLAGATYSIVKIDPVDSDTEPNVYKWQQGAFRLGEPGVQLIGSFARMPDPRLDTTDYDDPSTWGASRNPALLFAWNRFRAQGFAMPMDRIAWDMIAAEADLCDEVVHDKNGVAWPRYTAGLVFEEDKAPAQVEQLILGACDGIVLYDDEGRVYLKVGHWAEPTLALTSRDILAMASQTVEDGEAPLDGVVVTYTEPDYGYILQPAAPWLNPRYFVEGTTPNLLQVTVDACQGHNQAMRLAKAIGTAAQSAYRLGPTIGVRSLLARRERLIGLAYDEDFTGPHMITTPVEIDLETMTGSFSAVPVDADTWTLLEVEEGDRPRRDVANFDTAIPAATGVVVVAVPIVGSPGNALRLEADFDAPPSPIYTYEFEYSSDGGTTWQAMETDLPHLTALSPQVNAGISYEVHWRTVTSGGNYGDYSVPVTVLAAAHLTADSTSIRADSSLFTADAA